MAPTAVSSRKKGASSSRRYPLTDKFFSEVIRDTIRDTLFAEVPFTEKEVVKLKPGFDTACWAYLPPHRIYIGTDLFEKDSLKDGLGDALQRRYIANHYHHERGHAMYTERDMNRIQAALKSIKAPFPVYNLFEDAYMEDRYRREQKYRFEWLTMENLDFNPRAESLLFALIQAEGDEVVVETGLKDWEPKAPDPKVSADPKFAAFMKLFAPDPEDTRAELQRMFPRVVYYYKRIVSVRDSMSLMPILNAWLDEFGRPPEMPKSRPNGGMADLELSAQLMTNPEAAEEFDGKTKPVAGTGAGEDADEPTQGGRKEKAEAESVNSLPESKKGTVLHKSSTAVDMERAMALATKFLKFFAERTLMVSTATPQRRVSARHFALGRAPYRKPEVKGRGKKTVFLEIDCSGSMGGFHIMEGKLLLTALSTLARQGKVDGHVALSAVVNGQPMWEVYKLPVAQEVIDRIQAYAGAEGLEYTLRDNLHLLRKADYVFVYTDGQICDRPIDKSYFHRYGVYTWGLYAGENESFFDELMKYFDKAIMRSNAEDLVDAMLAQNK